MSLRPLVIASVVLACLADPSARAADPPERAPDAQAKPLEASAWKSKDGLRYTWVLPKGYDPAQPRALTVILHGTGLDYRWGHWNNKPGVFRPDDVVVSVDGTSPDGAVRVFLGEKKDVEAFAAFLAEMRATFAVDRVFLYGHSQGGFFVCHFAGEHPDQVAGVVAHASGAWSHSKSGKSVDPVSIAFLHGTADPVVPYAQSPGSRDAFAKAGRPLLHLRRLAGYNHWPNAVRATETLDWCDGMTAKTPEHALACALAILRAKKPDEYQWETVVGFAGARDVLRRIEGEGPAPFAEVAAETARTAQEWSAKIEAHGALHVAALRKTLPKKKGFELDGKPWLGHLVALREDMRGVDSVEALFAELGYDDLAAGHAKATKTFFDAWYQPKPPKALFEAALECLPKAFLFEGMPHDLAEKMKEWKSDSKLGASAKALKSWPLFEAWEQGWKDGAQTYEALWKQWKGP